MQGTDRSPRAQDMRNVTAERMLMALAPCLWHGRGAGEMQGHALLRLEMPTCPSRPCTAAVFSVKSVLIPTPSRG